jgi:hypothetical protein
MAKLLLFAILAGAIVDGIAVRSEPPLLIDSQPNHARLDAQR